LLHVFFNLTAFIVGLVFNDGGPTEIERTLDEGVGAPEIIFFAISGAAGLWWFFRFALPRMDWKEPAGDPEHETPSSSE